MRKFTLLLALLAASMQTQLLPHEMKLVTLTSKQCDVLEKKTTDIGPSDLPLAKSISEHLIQALSPYFPAAGLAAPQIGVSRSLFIYSYDRDPKNLETVINPTFTPLTDEKVEGWEGCLSVITDTWKLGKVPRYEKIHVSYLNLRGERVEKVLDGFAAKVFQHEYDHLQGILCITHPQATVKSFNSKEEMTTFLQEVKKEDATRYKKPE